MNKNRIYTFLSFLIIVVVLGACAATSHPNEKIIVGTWKPVKVEKVVDSSALMAAASMQSDAGQAKSKGGKTSGGGGNERAATYDRLIQVESRTTLQIFANKTAIKDYGGKKINATWKMKGHGTRIVAKNKENKMKFVLEIIDISKDRVVILEHAPVGDVKITYERVM